MTKDYNFLLIWEVLDSPMDAYSLRNLIQNIKHVFAPGIRSSKGKPCVIGGFPSQSPMTFRHGEQGPCGGKCVEMDKSTIITLGLLHINNAKME